MSSANKKALREVRSLAKCPALRSVRTPTIAINVGVVTGSPADEDRFECSLTKALTREYLKEFKKARTHFQKNPTDEGMTLIYLDRYEEISSAYLDKKHLDCATSFDEEICGPHWDICWLTKDRTADDCQEYGAECDPAEILPRLREAIEGRQAFYHGKTAQYGASAWPSRF